MINLALAMLSSMMVSFTMRLSEGRIKNNISMLATNYAMCAVLSVLYAGSLALPQGAQGVGFTVGWGALTGAMYLSGFLLLQWNIYKNGVVLPATFMKLGVVVPTVLSIVAFGEMPSALQVAGVVLAVVAIVMINTGKADASGGKAGSMLGLIALLLCGGLTDFTSKIYEETGNAALSDHYLLFTFCAALLLCALLAVFKKQKLTLRDVGFGMLIGVPNYYSARFLLASLSSVPAVVAYPTVNVGTIVLVTLCGMLVFGERLTRRQWTALCVILAALVLLNL